MLVRALQAVGVLGPTQLTDERLGQRGETKGRGWARSRYASLSRVRAEYRSYAAGPTDRRWSKSGWTGTMGREALEVSVCVVALS